jgi:integrase
MEMSIFKRGGVYWYEFIFQGERIQQSTGLRNKNASMQAEAIRKAELAEGRAGIRARKATPLFEKFVHEEFLPWAKAEHREHPNTYVRYDVSARALIPFFGRFRLGAISPGLVEKFKVVRSTVISPAGTNRDLAALRMILNYAKRQQHLDRNPVCDVKFFTEGPGNMRIVSHHEQKQYLAAASPLVSDIALLIVETGMRPHEAFRLRVEDVHLSQRYLKVVKGKTRLARRNILLTSPAIDVLKRRLAKAKGSFLYPHRSNPERPLDNIDRGHHIAVRAAGIVPGFRLYDFRHTFGSRSAMAGVDLATLKELMGHSSITTTLRYVHPTPEHKRKAMDMLENFNLDQLFGGPGNLESLQKSLQ